LRVRTKLYVCFAQFSRTFIDETFKRRAKST